jgi:hypothetical protein
VLKRTIVTVVAVAGLACAAWIPAASASAGAAAQSAGTCPPGSAVSSYCEPHCIVPELQGDTIKQAVAAIKAADCSVGLIYPAKGTSSDKFLTVDAQNPPAGTTRPAHWPVSIGIKL